MKLNQNIARRLLLYMESLGHSPSELCKQIGIIYFDILNQRIDYSGAELEQLWTICESYTSLDDIGFHFGQYLSIESLGTLGMLLQNVSTVEEGLKAASKFIPLVSEFINITLDTDDNELTISIIPDTSFHSRFPIRTKQACLLTVSLIIKMYTVLTMKKPRLNYAAMPGNVKNRNLLSYCYPHEIDLHPLHYIIRCDRAIFDYPIVFANAKMRPVILEMAQQEMKEAHKEWTSKVYVELNKQLDAPIPTLTDISRTLGVSNRSLQRKLKDEKSSFQAIVIMYKTHVAKALLSRSLHPKEVAIKLGYTDVTNFYKSFKQWTGLTIQEYLSTKQS